MWRVDAWNRRYPDMFGRGLSSARLEVYFSEIFGLLFEIVSYNRGEEMHSRILEAFIVISQQLKFLTVFLTVSKSLE